VSLFSNYLVHPCSICLDLFLILFFSLYTLYVERLKIKIVLNNYLYNGGETLEVISIDSSVLNVIIFQCENVKIAKNNYCFIVSINIIDF